MNDATICEKWATGRLAAVVRTWGTRPYIANDYRENLTTDFVQESE
jgi:hypothetical protein